MRSVSDGLQPPYYGQEIRRWEAVRELGTQRREVGHLSFQLIEGSLHLGTIWRGEQIGQTPARLGKRSIQGCHQHRLHSSDQ